jgi:hypothetical protein
MKLHSWFSLLVMPLLVSGCVKHTTVLGTYHASTATGVTDDIQLWQDGTYQQTVQKQNGQITEHLGQWRIGENQQVEVAGWIDPKAVALGLPGAAASRPDIVFLAPLSRFQKPKVPINVAY